MLPRKCLGYLARELQEAGEDGEPQQRLFRLNAIGISWADRLLYRSAQYNTIWEFGYTINGQPCDMVFTSVAGHLMELVFPDNYKNWRGVPPVSLYDASIQKVVPAVSMIARVCTGSAPWHKQP